MRLTTKRLILVAGTVDLARAELNGRSSFAAHLGAEVPDEWPPPLSGEEAIRGFIRILESGPAARNWAAWYFLMQRAGQPPLAIGMGGFKGPPSPHGLVEIGYSIVPTRQRQGFAPEAVDGLLTWAFAHPVVQNVVAHTLPDLRPSIRVLEKNGFEPDGPGAEEGTIRYRLRRPDWERARGGFSGMVPE